MKKNQTKDDDLEVPEFDFSKARRITPEEVAMYRKAYENTFGVPPPARRGRPPKKPHQKYRDVHLRIHPHALKWAKSLAKKLGVGYQTVINRTLLSHTD